MSRDSAEVGEVLISEFEPGRWSAVQVVGGGDGRPVVAALRWIGESAPGVLPSASPQDVVREGVLYESHHSHAGDQPTVLVVDSPRPHWSLESIGATDPSVPPETTRSAHWTNVVRSPALQFRWDQLPAETRAEYDSVPEPVGSTVRDIAVSTNGHFAQLGPTADLSLLQRHRWVMNLRLRGDPAGLTDWLRLQHGWVHIEEWSDPPDIIDLSDLPIARLVIQGDVHEIRGFGGVLFLDSDAVLPRLTESPRELVLERRVTDVADLVSAVPGAEELWIVGRGPGSVTNIDRLPELSRLRSLRISDCYRFDPSVLPVPNAWSELHSIELHHVPRRIADGLRRDSGEDPRVTVSGLRSEVWIRDNAENPFGDWIDDDRRLGRGAAKAWKAASRAMDKLPPDAAGAAVREIAVGLVEALNVLDATMKVGIDTLRREQAVAAIIELVGRRSAVGEDQVVAWVDELRTW